MPQIYIALDLETTGLEAERDAIIEIGAVKFRGDQVLDTFDTLVKPSRPIPDSVADLTGICDADVADAPRLHEVLDRLARFAGNHPIVGHSVLFDIEFLRRHAILSENETFDTFELAGVLLPGAGRYSLEALSKRVGISFDQTYHRALNDAQAARRLFQVLLRQAAALPPRLLKEIIGHGEKARWGASRFFAAALEEAARLPAEERKPLLFGAPHPEPLLANLSKAPPLQPAAERALLDVPQLASLLEQGGAFEARFPAYEHRPQQVAMLRRVAQAFNQQEHLLVEAPTGVGKSLAYLIPAVHWAVQNNARVVISTNTINLQEQLYYKDLPDLASVLPFSFRSVVLKGRSHYLCPARLQAFRRRGPRSPKEALVLAKVLVWQAISPGSDGDALFLPDPVEQAIWAQLSANHEGCEPERCPHVYKGACPFYAARQAAEAAHLIIVNHALLLADVAVQNRALPDYKHLIVDEAHHLEAATTDGLSFEADQASLERLLNEIGRLSASGGVTGLLAEVIGACQKARLPRELLDRVEISAGKIGLATERAYHQTKDFFDRLKAFVAEQREEGQNDQYALRLRLTSGLRVQPAWEPIEVTWENVSAPLAAAARELERLAEGLGNLETFDIPDIEDLQGQLVGAARRLEGARSQISGVISEPSPSHIYWLEAGADDCLRLHAAPLHIGPLVEEHLFRKKETVVLTSATLRAGGSFDFLRERLHAWEAEELAVGSPFDYKSSTLLYLVDDIPEPGQQGYQRAVEQGLVALFKATEGRALALFTSYSQLRATLQAIRAPLAQAGITVQAQGEGISRAQLLETFRTGERQVLLGTRSFWEGIDVPGEPLSCLAIAKLPFSVPSDPIFAARSEAFEQPFLEYAVPETILRFLQGFGRLIRSRTDRGVVAVFDKRLLTKSYGQMFLDSLPEPTVRRGPMALLPKAAAEWLSRGDQ